MGDSASYQLTTQLGGKRRSRTIALCPDHLSGKATARPFAREIADWDRALGYFTSDKGITRLPTSAVLVSSTRIRIVLASTRGSTYW